jgi:hypothetical protein
LLFFHSSAFFAQKKTAGRTTRFITLNFFVFVPDGHFLNSASKMPFFAAFAGGRLIVAEEYQFLSARALEWLAKKAKPRFAQFLYQRNHSKLGHHFGLAGQLFLFVSCHDMAPFFK